MLEQIEETSSHSHARSDSSEAETTLAKINRQFGKRLRSLRTQRKLNKGDLAHKVNMSLDRLTQLEGGQVSASLADLNDIANGFSVSIAELLEGL